MRRDETEWYTLGGVCRRTVNGANRLEETAALISIGAQYGSLQDEDCCSPPMAQRAQGVARGVLGVVLVNEPPVTTPFSFVAIYPVERRGSYQPNWRILSELHFCHHFSPY